MNDNNLDQCKECNIWYQLSSSLKFCNYVIKHCFSLDNNDRLKCDVCDTNYQHSY